MATPGFLDSISPWASRGTTPQPSPSRAGDGNSQLGLPNQQGYDHAISRRQRLSPQDYPLDCPKSTIKWFYAVDVSLAHHLHTSRRTCIVPVQLNNVRQVPKRKPLLLDKPPVDSKPLPPPKKYVPFSIKDSRSIELAFQKLAEKESGTARTTSSGTGQGNEAVSSTKVDSDGDPKSNTSIDDSTDSVRQGSVKVPVNEDFLFDVDVKKRELAPAYWLGPIYDVRRGSWFYQEGSSQRPCDENLASQLEEGYLRVKPWRNELNTGQAAFSRSRSRPTSMTPSRDLESKVNEDALQKIKTRSSESLRSNAIDGEAKQAPVPEKFQLQTQRLFGTYMNSLVTYQDATVAWLLTDDFYSRMSSTVYQRLAGGGHLGGVKVVRGYSEAKDKKKEADKSPNRTADASNKKAKPASTSHEADKSQTTVAAKDPQSQTLEDDQMSAIPMEPRLRMLERRMSSIVTSPDLHDPEKQDEELRKRDEDEIQEDYRDDDEDEQGREIEHLVLVTHGIGQRLGLRLESVNFIHDVNVLRKTIKDVYATSPDLQALNSEVERLPKNCRVQVLPVVWRHLLNFPKQSFKENSREQDLTDADDSGDEELYPSLDDITIEGVPAIRNLITDLALDILLYQSAYREHIASIVQKECNRVYDLFKQRNPSFKGKVDLIGHSLGSAILFDILCRQKEEVQDSSKLDSGRRRRSRASTMAGQEDRQQLGLNFEVEDFFCLGSPLGLYQMLKGRKIAGRKLLHHELAESPFDLGERTDPFLDVSSNQARSAAAEARSEILSITVSSPKCKRLFNIFHPADPISYRIEPLISPIMSSLKPQPLPYTKKGIFGAPGQGFTGIGARVGQSVSGLWSNIASGVASSLLNRSLGLTGEDQILPSQTKLAPPALNRSASPGAGTNIISGKVITPVVQLNNEEKLKVAEEVVNRELSSDRPSTLIDGEMETLYAGFQKHRQSLEMEEGGDSRETAQQREMDDKARRLKKEEAKVRALNSNGRVDFSIQEFVVFSFFSRRLIHSLTICDYRSMFDISLIASIASHLSYWADEDVSHFMISQLLAQQGMSRRDTSASRGR